MRRLGTGQPGAAVIRIQRQRTKGWRMPAGARYVGRGTRWGNPFRTEPLPPGAGPWEAIRTRVALLIRYRRWLVDQLVVDPAFLDPLRGAPALACWCPLTERCHADVLIEVLA